MTNFSTESHYTYLDKNIEKFFIEVFGNDHRYTPLALIDAHGDKAYQYMDSWEDNGIPFNHGVLLYMLTFTTELGDYKKHESSQWVIDHYSKYKNTIFKIENN